MTKDSRTTPATCIRWYSAFNTLGYASTSNNADIETPGCLSKKAVNSSTPKSARFLRKLAFAEGGGSLPLFRTAVEKLNPFTASPISPSFGLAHALRTKVSNSVRSSGENVSQAFIVGKVIVAKVVQVSWQEPSRVAATLRPDPRQRETLLVESVENERTSPQYEAYSAKRG